MIAPWISARWAGATITPVTAGWSDDQKLKIETGTGSFLLRLSPADALARKQDEFAQLRQLNRQTDAFPQAIECGASPDGSQCYVLYGWVEGEDALNVLPTLSEDACFQLGLEAGRLLRQIHTLPQPIVIDAHAVIARKVATRRQQMEEAGLIFPAYPAMLAFLDTHLGLLRGAPTAYHHGDFHLGNMLVDAHGRLKVIDFNRSDFGDPVEDFNRLFTFSRQTNPAFARGQIHGYFDEIPATFFPHALCYVLIDCAFGLLWARRYGQREIDVHFSLVDQTMRDFNQLKTTRPTWFEDRA
jgi:aminoglycoside phosphotransferase (APT) family kinase protein